ncbi:MAG: PadR family transcriptional regulator [Acidobacteria bacterium]|nr:PadR family transcriptional regulator [Acidobacteriota bacterium]
MFHILMSLADRPRHGYGILREIEGRTDGEVRMGTGTLYSAIRRLLNKGVIRESSSRPDTDDDERRVYYELTDEGLAAARGEARRLGLLVAQARSKQLLPRG